MPTLCYAETAIKCLGLCFFEYNEAFYQHKRKKKELPLFTTA
jgi:hypothetical protein